MHCSETSAVLVRVCEEAQEASLERLQHADKWWAGSWRLVNRLRKTAVRNVVKVDLFLLAIVESLYDGGYQ